MDARLLGLNGKKLTSGYIVAVPSSKSHTIRALLIAAMADGESSLINPLDSADARSCIDACRSFGAIIYTELKTPDNLPLWLVTGRGKRFPKNMDSINVGNSGTSLYLASGVAALADSAVEFTGDEQIQRRPVRALLDSLEDLGARVEIEGDNPPFSITGPLTGGKTSIECPTSQYLSSLLICTPLADGDSSIEVPLLMEKPYVEMTLRWLDRQGIKYENDNFKRFRIPGRQQYQPFKEPIPGDFSSAAFPLCAAAITGSELTLSGLDINDSQGDKAIIDYLRTMGCDIKIQDFDGLITIRGPEKLQAAEIDLNDTPDALPAMAVTACFAEGETRLYNVPQARLKETDRIAVMRQELRKLGADVEEMPDGLIIRGGKQLTGCRVNGHGDHRVVMSLAVAALGCSGETVISDAEAVDITYPGFFEQFEKLWNNQ